MKEAALKYLEMGYSVIPMKKDKKPYFLWKEFQTRHPSREEIIHWWDMYPDANVAIITGKISGIAVVDVEKGGDVAGLPMTRIVKTGGGGWHYYYKYQDGIENKVRLREKTDIRGEGGYVVAPPSIHASGEQYFWTDESETIANFPSGMIVEIVQPKNTDWQKIVQGVPEGMRNDSAAKLFGKLLPAFSRDEWNPVIWELGKIWNQRNSSPLPENELHDVFESIAKRESSKAATSPADQKVDFEPISFSELSNMQIPPIEWLVEKLITEESITILSGRPSSYKTWIMLHLAIQLAKGEPLFGQLSTIRTNVLIIDEESGLRRLKAWLSRLTRDENLPISFVSSKDFKLTAESVPKIIAFCEKNDIKMVMFDSLVRMHTANENEASAMAGVGELLKKIKNEGISVFLTHHHRKQISGDPSQDMRGSSDILALLDCHLSVSRKEKVLTIMQNKLRDEEETKPFEVVVKRDDNSNSTSFEYVGEIEPAKIKGNAIKDLVIVILGDAEAPLSTKEIFERVKETIPCGKSTLKPVLEQLVENEEIIKGKGSKNANFYSLEPFEDKQVKIPIL